MKIDKCIKFCKICIQNVQLFLPHSQECPGPSSPHIADFFGSYSPAQACATALIIAVDPNSSPRVAEWATECLFR